MQEMQDGGHLERRLARQVIGQLVAHSESCEVAVRNAVSPAKTPHFWLHEHLECGG